MKALKEIPNFKSEDEEREFWGNVENIFDYLDPEKFVSIDPPMVPKTFGLHDVRLSPEMERDVQRLSRERKLSVEEMVRQLVAAGLKQQGLQPGA
jgi:hypothetical protein